MTDGLIFVTVFVVAGLWRSVRLWTDRLPTKTCAALLRLPRVLIKIYIPLSGIRAL
jgi:hypothetical protein